MWKRIISNKAAAIAAAATLFVLGTVGAGAATGSPFTEPVNDVLNNLGLSGQQGADVNGDGDNCADPKNHGDAVSCAVHQAKEDLEDGEKVGPAVSEAACTAAHDRSTLPHADDDADGGEDIDGDDGGDGEEMTKDCTHPSNVEAEDDEGQDGDGDNGDADVNGDEDNCDDPKNHGDAVSCAVHQAKQDLEPGEKVGPAVSEAACKAAHDKETLPDGAKDAPGHNKPEEKQKDCTHPSNADGQPAGAGSGHGSGHGKDSAPGQQKKNQ